MDNLGHLGFEVRVFWPTRRPRRAPYDMNALFSVPGASWNDASWQVR